MFSLCPIMLQSLKKKLSTDPDIFPQFFRPQLGQNFPFGPKEMFLEI